MNTTMDNPTTAAQKAASGVRRRTYKTPVHAAKRLAQLLGHKGDGGGWIRHYNTTSICQGWDSYADRQLKAGLLEKTETGGCTVTPKGQEAIEAAPAKIEAHRVAVLKEQLEEIATRAQEALSSLEHSGLCERSMDRVMGVEAGARDITRTSDQLDWRC